MWKQTGLIAAILTIVAISMNAGCGHASGQDLDDQELALQLASENTRDAAVKRVVALGSAKLPLLLLWAQEPPPDVFEYELKIGLAEVFGSLKTTAAIPFLIRNISIEKSSSGNPWSRAPEYIEATFPAVGALIRIGPPGARAVIQASEEPMSHRDRLASVFVVSRVAGVAEAKEYLWQARAEANLQAQYATEGLRAWGMQ